MTSTTAKLAAHKLNDACGVSDDLAEKMYRSLGSKHMAIVELEVFEKTEGLGENANHVVRLRPIHLELAAGDHAQHLRELSRALYTDRQPRGLDQLAEGEEDADEIIRRGRNVLLLCDTCLHRATDERINHAPDTQADGAECKWKDTNEPVEPGDDDETEAGIEIEVPPEGLVAEVGADSDEPDDIDQPWPGDPDYTPPADPDLTPTLGDPFAKADQ